MPIQLSGYSKFLAEIQNCLKQAQDKIINTVTRQKVVMSWQMGQLIDGHLKKNNRAEYGEKLFTQLAQDTAISKRVLYQMRSFYQAYHELPEDNANLNWSHYQTLSGIKKKSQRKYFETLVQEQNWDVKTLEQEIKTDEKSAQKNTKKDDKKTSKKPTSTTLVKLRPERGTLFSYPIVQHDAEQKSYVDCGFKIFREVEGRLGGASERVSGAKGVQNVTKIVNVTKNGERYTYKKSASNARKLNTYVAQLERVVDGDTIHVLIDVGFKTKHREILRLAKINAPESDTPEGKRSSDALKQILRDVPFLIVKTFRTDIYGRYIADVFLPSLPKKSAASRTTAAGRASKAMSWVKLSPQKIADSGIYLNQLLLDQGLAGPY